MLVALGILGTGHALAGDVSKKLKREINVVEEFIDDMLVVSSIWLVAGGHVARGAYADGGCTPSGVMRPTPRFSGGRLAARPLQPVVS